MSISAALDGVLQTQIASNQGWHDFVRWVERLPAIRYDYLKHLIDYGWSEKLPSVEIQLRKALDATPPDAATAATARGLLELLESRDDDQTVLTITDGLTT